MGVFEKRRSKISRRQLRNSRSPPGFEKADRELWFELEQVQEVNKNEWEVGSAPQRHLGSFRETKTQQKCHTTTILWLLVQPGMQEFSVVNTVFLLVPSQILSSHTVPNAIAHRFQPVSLLVLGIAKCNASL